MSFKEHRVFLEDLSRLARSNPFSPEWVQLEKKALGSKFCQAGTVHLWTDEKIGNHPNLVKLTNKTKALAKELLASLEAGGAPKGKDRLSYRYLVLYLLYRRHRGDFDSLIDAHGSRAVSNLWDKFLPGYEEYFPELGSEPWTPLSAEHVFALFFQIRRAFRHIFDCLVGSSESIIRLRAQVWNSIFTHDIHNYCEKLYTRMSEFNTLITGDSGTGKELVARAIGMSQYIEFDSSKRQFETDPGDSFRAVNLAGMPASLIESELFGHVEGAFTGATRNQKGWLESANKTDVLFLDEIGELDSSLQVKLLRALQTRTFYRVGDQTKRHWKGKVIAATNCDLSEEVRQGRFREDLYYRLCGDVIETPSLRRQLDEAPQDLNDLVIFAAKQVAGNDCDAVVNRVETWITRNMLDYPWPGNFRELEQCVRNVLIRAEYRPVENMRFRRFDGTNDAVRYLAEQRLRMDGLEHAYCKEVLEQVGGQYSAAAAILGLNWRTVKCHAENVSPPRKAK